MGRTKYTLAFALPILTWFGFSQEGWLSATALIFAYVAFPILELFLPPDHANMDEKMAADERNAPFYDRLLNLAVICYAITFIYFFIVIQNTAFGTWEYYIKVMSMGVMAGIYGINIGHELTHRVNDRVAYTLGQILLLASLNLHFIPFHLGGHHRNVGKPTDPSTAARNELIFAFWFRSQIGGYIEAWRIDNQITARNGYSIYSFNNRMVRYTMTTIAYLAFLYFVLSAHQYIAYLIVVAISIILLETINYIEHYGLVRTQNDNGKFESVKHHHSWNSDHTFGRVMMFNLSRHSDHHYNGSIKYQSLKYIPDTPQMPTGYPGMFILAFIPPLWFYIMNKRLEKYSTD